MSAKKIKAFMDDLRAKGFSVESTEDDDAVYTKVDLNAADTETAAAIIEKLKSLSGDGDTLKAVRVDGNESNEIDSMRERTHEALQRIGENGYQPFYGKINLKPKVQPIAGAWFKTNHGGHVYMLGKFSHEDQLKADLFVAVKDYEWIGIAVNPQGDFAEFLAFNHEGYVYDLARCLNEKVKLVNYDLMGMVEPSLVSMGSRLHFMRKK